MKERFSCGSICQPLVGSLGVLYAGDWWRWTGYRLDIRKLKLLVRMNLFWWACWRKVFHFQGRILGQKWNKLPFCSRYWARFYKNGRGGIWHGAYSELRLVLYSLAWRNKTILQKNIWNKKLKKFKVSRICSGQQQEHITVFWGWINGFSSCSGGILRSFHFIYVASMFWDQNWSHFLYSLCLYDGVHTIVKDLSGLWLW